MISITQIESKIMNLIKTLVGVLGFKIILLHLQHKISPIWH